MLKIRRAPSETSKRVGLSPNGSLRIRAEYARLVLTAMMIEADPITSLWATAFQMGREFEQRVAEVELLENLVK